MPTLTWSRKQALLDKVRRCAVDTRAKRAAIGGDPESGFEQSFASLAHSYVSDAAPGLMDYMIGFQLVDRNDDNTKAVGIFGFQLDKQWLYAPVFFMAGELKGHELLYLKNQDTFVPLKENWINYLLSKQPSVLGKGTGDSLQRLGVFNPDMRSLVYPPSSGKSASMRELPPLPAWARGVMPQFASWAVKHPFKLDKFAGLDERADLRTFLASDVRLAAAAVSLCEQYPAIKAACNEFYGPRLLQEVLEGHQRAALAEPSPVLRKAAAAPRPSLILKQAVAEPPAKVKVDTDKTITENDNLSQKEKEKLMQDGYLVRDYREGDEVAVAYNTQVEMRLSNPDTTAVYDLLLKPYDFSRCLVIHNPHAQDGRKAYCVAIALDDEKRWCNCYSTGLFVRHDSESLSDQETFGKWFEGLSSTKDLKKGGHYVMLGDNAQGTCVFEVLDDDGNDCYHVHWRTYCPRPEGITTFDDHHNGRQFPPWDQYENVRPSVIFNQRRGSRFKSINGNLYVPDQAKVIKIKDPPKPKKDEYPHCCSPATSGSEPVPLMPGNLADIQLEIMQKTSELKLVADGCEAVVNDRRLPKLAALFHLIRDHGLREDVAKELLKKAESFGGMKFRVKYAYSPNPDLQPGPSGPGFPEAEYGDAGTYMPQQEIQPQTSFQQVQDLDPNQNDRQIYDPRMEFDPPSLQVAQQAQQTGQKEVFDTAMIGTMLKSVRDDTLIDRHLGDLMKALDRLGRLLFCFYWHNTDFSERFGKQDMPELEDTLRNAFEVMGDLILFLKQQGQEGRGGDLLGAANIDQSSDR